MLSTIGRTLLTIVRIYARPARRIAKSLELLTELYELDLNSRGIYRPHKPSPGDDARVEVMYGPQSPKAEDLY